jgi:hypothetical protein
MCLYLTAAMEQQHDFDENVYKFDATEGHADVMIFNLIQLAREVVIQERL